MPDLPAGVLPADALRVVATLPTDPAHASEAAAALAVLAAASREEDGCYAYDVFESGSVPGTFVTVEAWRSPADMDAHLATAHIAEAFTVLGPLIAGDVAIHPLRAV